MKATCFGLALALSLLGYSGRLFAATAADCYNPRLSKEGTVVEQRFRSTDKLTKERFLWDSTSTGMGKATFNGKNALLVSTESTFEQLGVTNTVVADNYFSVQNAKSRIRSFGSVGTSFIDGEEQGSAETSYDPAQLVRYDLNPGQRYAQKVTVEFITGTLEGDLVDTFQQRTIRTYLRRQTISTPLGKREACKFKIVDVVSRSLVTTRSVRTEWYDVKSGLLLKANDKENVTVLLRGTIDGRKI